MPAFSLALEPGTPAPDGPAELTLIYVIVDCVVFILLVCFVGAGFTTGVMAVGSLPPSFPLFGPTIVLEMPAAAA